MPSLLTQDLRYAARLLRRQLRPTLLTVVTLATGIGATTILFGVTYGVLIKPLPWPQAERVVVLSETRGGSAPRFGAFTNTVYLAWREQARTMESIAAWSPRVVTLSGAGQPDRIRIIEATASLFSVLHIRPLIGTTFDEKDETLPLVVLSERLWRDRFSADPAVIGHVVQLDGASHTVVAVLPDDFAYPDHQTLAVVPLSVQPSAGNVLSLFNAVGALRPGTTSAQAAAEGTARARFAADTSTTTTAIFGNNGRIDIAAQPLADAMTSEVRRPLVVLLVGVGLLLLTATANVANLQLARTMTRRREVGIRMALGAGAARVARQLLVESLLVGAIGGAAGLALTWLAHRAIPSLLPGDFPRVHDLRVDMTVVLFAIVITIGTSSLIGLLPALRLRRLDILESLIKDGSSGAGTRPAPARTRLLMMTGQVAIACVLLIAASLLGRSFLALVSADRGFDSFSVLSARLSMPSAIYPSPERRFAIVEQILHRLESAPEVRDAAFTSELPLSPGGSTAAFDLKSPDASGGVVRVQTSPRIVSAHYFAAIGMRLRAGRGFNDHDTETSEPVVIVNESFARRYLGGAALGAKIPMVAYGASDNGAIESTVIGIVDDVRYVNAVRSSQAELYYSHRQMGRRLPVQTVTLMVRTTTNGAFAGAAAALRSVVAEADPSLVAEAVMPLQQRLLSTLARPRLYALLLGGFAAFALLIAAVGLFGMLSYAVSQHSRELAIRAALGARPWDLVGLLLRQGLAVSCAGTMIGLAVSAWVMRLLSTQLYGVTPHDARTFVLVPLVLLLCGALACVMPARRAARLDPLQVLRGE